MGRNIVIKAGDIVVKGTLNESQTSDKIWDALPVEARGKIWGDEIYFDIFIEINREDAKTIVDKGDICYWPLGSAMCLFFGPTPLSIKGEIKAASPVNIVGKMEGDSEILKGFSAGDTVVVERAP
jgi:hypothetical protein